MKSFSERRSYRAVLQDEKAELSAEQGNGSATKKKEEIALAAPPTVPTVPLSVYINSQQSRVDSTRVGKCKL
jgi:hypothetical protein